VYIFQMPPNRLQLNPKKEHLEMKTKLHILMVVVLIALVIPTSVVFAKELGMLTISGPGIKGEVSLNDHEAMMDLEQAGFFSTSALAKAPGDINLDMGYNITAHLNLDGKLVPFVQMVYYPTTATQPGYVHYIGRLEGESLRTVDEWSLLNGQSDRVLRVLMEDNNIALQSALLAGVVAPSAAKPVTDTEPVVAAQPVTNSEPVAAPAASSAPGQFPYSVLTIVAATLLLIGAGLAIRRRTINHTTT
jgi:hypothetical protein